MRRSTEGYNAYFGEVEADLIRKINRHKGEAIVVEITKSYSLIDDDATPIKRKETEIIEGFLEEAREEVLRLGVPRYGRIEDPMK